MEEYTKVSDTEAKKITTTVTEEVVLITDIENQLKQIEEAYAQIDEEYAAKKAELDTYRDNLIGQKKQMADVGVVAVVVDMEPLSETIIT